MMPLIRSASLSIFLFFIGVASTWAAVTFDSVATNTVAAGTSVPAFNVTLVANTNMAVAVFIQMSANNATGITVTVGGTSASLVASTDTAAAQAIRTLIYCVAKGTATGAQSVAVSWTTAMDVIAGAIGVTGANQTTPCQNGVTASGLDAGPSSVTITSASGDLTAATTAVPFGTTLSAPTQTSRWSITNSNVNGAGSTAAGAATVTHSWTMSGSAGHVASGVDFLAASGGGPACPKTLLLMGAGC